MKKGANREGTPATRSPSDFGRGLAKRYLRSSATLVPPVVTVRVTGIFMGTASPVVPVVALVFEESIVIVPK
jgi:hypothetical protein